MRIRKYKIRNEEHEVADLRILKAQLNQQLFMISQPNEKVMDAHGRDGTVSVSL